MLFAFLALLPAATPDPSAAALLAKVSAAYQRNHEREVHWNWTAVETRTLVDRSGSTLEEYPSVTAESLMRSNGTRCNAVVSWGDGLAPYMANADPDSRCRAMDEFRPAFDVAALLQSTSVKRVSATELLIEPDKPRQKSPDAATRCAASIQAKVQFDPATFFPRRIEGEVTGTGCDRSASPIIQYGSTRDSKRMRSMFSKGASFKMEFGFQKDKFQNPENSFWICTRQRYSLPNVGANWMLVYWGRVLYVRAAGENHRLIKDIQTTAQEFGAVSQPRYDTIGH